MVSTSIGTEGLRWKMEKMFIADDLDTLLTESALLRIDQQFWEES